MIFTKIEFVYTKLVIGSHTSHKSKTIKSLFIRMRAFIKVAKLSSSFIIYEIPTFTIVITSAIILKHYKGFKYVLEK